MSVFQTICTSLKSGNFPRLCFVYVAYGSDHMKSDALQLHMYLLGSACTMYVHLAHCDVAAVVAQASLHVDGYQLVHHIVIASIKWLELA